MSSEAQIAANQANAQQSTGPSSPEGRSTSSRNAVSHGLNATPNTLFASDTEAQNNFAQHIQKLRKDCLPESQLEEETFRRYAFATFQITRAQDRWINNPDHPKWFSQMERFIKLGALQERQADKALNELRKLQRDRFAALEVQGEIYAYGKEVNFSKALPIADIRTQNLYKTSAGLIAISLLATTEEAKAIARTKPNPVGEADDYTSSRTKTSSVSA